MSGQQETKTMCPDVSFEKPLLSSRAAIEANRRLWEDIPEGNDGTMTDSEPSLVPYGMMIRSEDDEGFFNHLDNFLGRKTEGVKLKPSTFLHASVRAPSVVYRDYHTEHGVAMIYSSSQQPTNTNQSPQPQVQRKLLEQEPSESSSLRSSQGRRILQSNNENEDKSEDNNHPEGRRLTETMPRSSHPSVVLCHPTDGGTGRRPAFDGPPDGTVLTTDHGQGCRGESTSEDMCIKNNVFKLTQTNGGVVVGLPQEEVCLMDEKCRCNDLSPYFRMDRKGEPYPLQYADFAVDFAQRKHKLGNPPYGMSCWYEDVHNRMTEMVDASNSMWMKRDSWAREKNPMEYIGLNECLLGNALDTDASNIDAFLIELSPNIGRFENLDTIHEEVLCGLISDEQVPRQLNYVRKKYGDKPVLLLEERLGMNDESLLHECQRMWGGKNCASGFWKNFIAQPLNFSDGSCLAVPPGCNEVYFFPANEDGKGCQISTPSACADSDHDTSTPNQVHDNQKNTDNYDGPSTYHDFKNHNSNQHGSCVSQYQLNILIFGFVIFFILFRAIRQEQFSRQRRRQCHIGQKELSSRSTTTGSCSTTSTIILSTTTSGVQKPLLESL